MGLGVDGAEYALRVGQSSVHGSNSRGSDINDYRMGGCGKEFEGT